MKCIILKYAVGRKNKWAFVGSLYRFITSTYVVLNSHNKPESSYPSTDFDMLVLRKLGYRKDNYVA